MGEIDKTAADIVAAWPIRREWREELQAEIATAIRTAIAADRQRVSGAVRGLIEKLPRCTYAKSPYLNAPIAEWIICTRTATRGSPRGPTLCDEHGATTGESNYAPALRAVLAMLDGDKRLAASVVADHATTHTAKVERVVEAARALRNGRRHDGNHGKRMRALRDAVDALDGEGGEGR